MLAILPCTNLDHLILNVDFTLNVVPLSHPLLRLGRAPPRPPRPEVVSPVLHPVGVAALQDDEIIRQSKYFGLG